MNRATMACLALLLIPTAGAARAIDKPAQPAAAQAAQPAAQAAPAQAAPANPPRGVEPRRRRSGYARCNRLSHERGLRGGARRRFLIRCRLGYVRNKPGQAATQPPQVQPQGQPQPQPAVPPADTQPPVQGTRPAAPVPAKRP